MQAFTIYAAFLIPPHPPNRFNVDLKRRRSLYSDDGLAVNIEQKGGWGGYFLTHCVKMCHQIH